MEIISQEMTRDVRHTGILYVSQSIPGFKEDIFHDMMCGGLLGFGFYFFYLSGNKSCN